MTKERHSIRPISINSYLQMQVTTCYPSGLADIADDLPRLYLLTGGDADRRTVGVQCFQPAAVVDLDVIAVAAAPAVKTIGNGDSSICGGEDRRALGTGNVGAGMGTDCASDGINTIAEL